MANLLRRGNRRTPLLHHNWDATLCDDLTATQTLYPGTNLTLTYTTKNP